MIHADTHSPWTLDETFRFVLAVLAAGSAGPVAGGGCARKRRPRGIDNIDTVVVIYAENRSFDNLYGSFPGRQRLAERHARKFHAARPRRHPF